MRGSREKGAGLRDQVPPPPFQTLYNELLVVLVSSTEYFLLSRSVASSIE